LLIIAGLAAACSRERPLDEQIEAHLERGDAAQAMALVERALRDQPGNAAIQDLRVRVLLRIDTPDAALRAYAERWGQGGSDSPAVFRQVAAGLLQAGLRAPDGVLRSRAAGALAAWHAPDLLPVFREALAHPEAPVRALGVQGMGKLPGEEPARLLLGAFDDLQAEVRAAAAAASAGRSDPETRAALERALTDADPLVRMRAAATLAKDGNGVATGLLATLLADGRDSIRMQSAEAVGHLGLRETAPKLRSLLRDANPYVRIYAAEALVRLGAADARRVLTAGLSHPDRSVAL